MHKTRTEPQDLTIGQLLTQVCRLTAYQVRLKMERVGLHRAQGPALFFLQHHEGASQNQIARAFHLTAASVTNMLQRMERDGWVVRRPDGEDQRITRVYPTEKAKALHEEARASFRELDEEIVGALEVPEQAVFRQLLAKVHARLIGRMPPDRHAGPPDVDDEAEGGRSCDP
jgi:DNA-binding MarR family transcriptional regulator